MFSGLKHGYRVSVPTNLQSDIPLSPDRQVLHRQPEYTDVTEELVVSISLVARYFAVRKIMATLSFGEPLMIPH